MKTKQFLYSLIYCCILSFNMKGQEGVSTCLGRGGYSIDRTTDNGFFTVGYTNWYNSIQTIDNNFYLVKTDYQGTKIWEKVYGGNQHDELVSGHQSNDGGFIALGNTMSYGQGSTELILIKTDAQGDLSWAQTFGGAYQEAAATVQQVNGGYYAIAGTSNSFGAGDPDILFIKTDMDGNAVESKLIGEANVAEGAKHMKETSDGGFIIVGYKAAPSYAFTDIYLVKTSFDGDVLWEKSFGGAKDDIGYKVIETSDGGFIISGFTTINNRLPYLIKTDKNGNQLWAKSFPDHPILASEVSVVESPDNGYMLTTEDIVIKTDNNGNELWYKWLGSSTAISHSIAYFSELNNNEGGYVITGDSYGAENMFLAITNIKGCAAPIKPSNYAGNDTAICIGETAIIGNPLWNNSSFNFNWEQGDGISNADLNQPALYAFPSSTTTYVETVTSFCDAYKDTVTVYVDQTPPVAFAGNDTTINQGDSIQINAVGEGNILWNPGYGLSSAMDTNPWAKPDSTTSYILTVTNGCGSNSDTLVIAVNNSPLNFKVISQSAFATSVYPNPIDNYSTLSLSSEIDLSTNPLEFVLYNQIGKEIKRTFLMSYENTITRDGLSSGLYIYKIHANSSVVGSGKIIVK